MTSCISKKNIIVIINSKSAPFRNIGNLEIILKRRNYIVRYIDAYLDIDSIKCIPPSKLDLLIILGGPMSAYDEVKYPFLIDELSLLEHRLANNLPTIGICLGCQLIVRALAYNVYQGSQGEFGWAPLKLNDQSMHTPIAHLAPEYTPSFHWHTDTFDLPRSANLLASTSKYQNQAFSWGYNCLGLQFHPEVCRQSLMQWFMGKSREIIRIPKMNYVHLLISTIQYADKYSAQINKFWTSYLDKLDL